MAVLRRVVDPWPACLASRQYPCPCLVVCKVLLGSQFFRHPFRVCPASGLLAWPAAKSCPLRPRPRLLSRPALSLPQPRRAQRQPLRRTVPSIDRRTHPSQTSPHLVCFCQPPLVRCHVIVRSVLESASASASTHLSGASVARHRSDPRFGAWYY